MERNVSLDEISDGRLYGSNDMVKADCNDCKGCSACCRGMGSSITLDPLDIFRLCRHFNTTFEGLLTDKIELNVVDGIIIPNIKMAMPEEKCSFLNENGRCTIHEDRPGICRLFPLGRIYENNTFKYFLQVYECKNNNKTKVKVKKWIDTPNLKENEQFITSWHYLLKELETIIKEASNDSSAKQINMYVLNNFYVNAYDTNADFYVQFNSRLEAARKFIMELKSR